MAISKKGQRKITVNDIPFYWKVRKKISHNEGHDDCLHIAIQAVEGGQVLWAEIDFARSGGGYEPKKITQITPSLIRKCILKAIAAGWTYATKGSLLELDCTELT